MMSPVRRPIQDEIDRVGAVLNAVDADLEEEEKQQVGEELMQDILP